MTLEELYDKGHDAPRNTREYAAWDRARRTVTGLQYSVGLPPENTAKIADLGRCEAILRVLLPDQENVFSPDGELDNRLFPEIQKNAKEMKMEYDSATMDETLAKIDVREAMRAEEAAYEMEL